jgi:flagellar basal-body rod protein FlgB
MDVNDIPLFAMLKSKLSYTTQRQQVIAQNVANADTPGFAPRDLKPFSFDAALKSAGGLAMLGPQRADAPGYIDLGGPKAGAPQDTAAPDSEVRLDGNRVVLEEQMIKMNEARSDYDTAVSLYTQSLNMMRTAIRKPGG